MFESLTIVMILVGMTFVFLSYYIKAQHEENQDHSIEEYEEYQLKLKEINDKIIELNDFSEFIKKELDEKHSELLFLYHMISEKSKSLSGMTLKEDNSKDNIETLIYEEISEEKKIVINDKVEQSKKILDLYKEGQTITEIAKVLEIGQGEVKLTLNLFS